MNQIGLLYESYITAKKHNQVKISIADYGIEKYFCNLFATKTLNKYTYSELAIARQVIEETHNGKLILNSVQGESTEFLLAIQV